MTIKESIIRLTEKQSLSYQEAKETFLEILEGKVTPAQVAAFLTALRMKGETTGEIRAVAEVMRDKSLKLNVRDNIVDIDREDINADKETILDTCGTGGKTTKTFNISTCTAFVIAAAGIKVAKHGNRSFSGVCGSADVVEGLGINISVSPELVEKAVRKVGIGFLYAPLYHPAMRNVASIRKEMGIRTIFNIVGPLTNPAGASHQVLGVYDKSLTEKIAEVLRQLGIVRAFVVWGEDVCDEVSITGKTQVSELKEGKINTYKVSPEDFGLTKKPFGQITGGGVQENIESVLSVLRAEPSAKLDIVLANAAVCFVALNKAGDFKEGVEIAKECIQNRKAMNKLEELRNFMQGADKG